VSVNPVDTFAFEFARTATGPTPGKVRQLRGAWEFAALALQPAGDQGLINKLRPHIQQCGWRIARGSRWFDANNQSGVYVAVYPAGLLAEEEEAINIPFRFMRLFVFKPGNFEQPCIMTQVVTPQEWHERSKLRDRYRAQYQR